jgi:hypothetical protein
MMSISGAPIVYREITKFLSFVYFLVGMPAGAVSLPLGDAIFAQLIELS